MIAVNWQRSLYDTTIMTSLTEQSLCRLVVRLLGFGARVLALACARYAKTVQRVRDALRFVFVGQEVLGGAQAGFLADVGHL